MTPDDLAAELLAATLDADPLAGSLYGFSGYDERLPDFSRASELAQSERLATLAEQAGKFDEGGLSEVQLQTLDFVRRMADNMAGAATVPLVEFTICDTFVDPVDSVLTLLPKLAFDTKERQDGYVARLRGMPEMLATVAERHREGTAAGRTAVRRLVESAMTQIELLGQMRPPAAWPSSITTMRHSSTAWPPRSRLTFDLRSPTIATALRPMSCPQPATTNIRGSAISPTATPCTPSWSSCTHRPVHAEELHAMGIEIVDQVSEEFRETGSKLWGTTDLGEIFDRLTHDRSLRYESREEMLEHARRVVAAAEAEAPKWFGVVPKEACVIEPIPEPRRPAWPQPITWWSAIDGSRKGTYFLNTSKPEERHRYARGRRLSRGCPGSPLSS